MSNAIKLAIVCAYLGSDLLCMFNNSGILSDRNKFLIANANREYTQRTSGSIVADYKYIHFRIKFHLRSGQVLLHQIDKCGPIQVRLKPNLTNKKSV